MKKTPLEIMFALAVLGLLAFPVLNTVEPESFGGSSGAHTERACAPGSYISDTIEIGNQASTEVVATGTHAFVELKQPQHATNTATLSFDRGTAAVAGIGYTLPIQQEGTTTPNFKTFGLKTDFPYTSSVQAITDSGSTTLERIVCDY